MATTYRDTKTTNGLGTTFVVNKPTGTVDGDLLILIAGWRSQGRTFTPPASFTSVEAVTNGTVCQTVVYQKVASSEGASYSMSISGANTYYCVAMLAFQYAEIAWDGSRVFSTTTDMSYDLSAPAAGPRTLVFAALGSGLATTAATYSGWSVSVSNPTWTETSDFTQAPDGLFTLGTAYALRTQTTGPGTWAVTAAGSQSKSTIHGITLSDTTPAVTTYMKPELFGVW